MISALVAVICLVSFVTSQETPISDVAAQLDAIHRDYLAGPDVAGLVKLDGRLRDLIQKPWNRAGQFIDGKIFQPQWSAIGIDVGHYSDALEYSGKLLVEAHKKNPVSKFRRFTLFAAVMGERPSHGLGEMPNVTVALQYLKEFPNGPFAREVNIILGNFYSDLFKVIMGKERAGYKYDCFKKYLKSTNPSVQAGRARRLSLSYYVQALTTAPAGWKETMDVRHRQSVMEGGDIELIELAGWHFCAD